MNLKIGDTVQLKSGGPIMTVENIEDNFVRCVWFEKNQVQRAAFPPVTLAKEADYSSD